jgi:hypothetical protein
MTSAARKFAQLPLLCQNGRWLMRFRGKRAEFADRDAALREAIREAFDHSRNGTPTQVVCIDEHLAIEIVWTYGNDPDPPAAFAEMRQAPAHQPMTHHAAAPAASPRRRAARAMNGR